MALKKRKQLNFQGEHETCAIKRSKSRFIFSRLFPLLPPRGEQENVRDEQENVRGEQERVKGDFELNAVTVSLTPNKFLYPPLKLTTKIREVTKLWTLKIVNIQERFQKRFLKIICCLYQREVAQDGRCCFHISQNDLFLTSILSLQYFSS